jgi:hypothetical protein
MLFKRRQAEPAGPVERPDVRQYRYLLRTADLDALEILHREALAALDPLIRAHILRTAQDRLLSGRELTVDDIRGLAHLVATGEVRTPGILVSALTDAALERLAHFVVGRPSALPLLEDYGAWDGSDPDPRQAGNRRTAQGDPSVASPGAPETTTPEVPQVTRRVARQHA